jgi:hypothetical protein
VYAEGDWADAVRAHQPSDWMLPMVKAKTSKKHHHFDFSMSDFLVLVAKSIVDSNESKSQANEARPRQRGSDSSAGGYPRLGRGADFYAV